MAVHVLQQLSYSCEFPQFNEHRHHIYTSKFIPILLDGCNPELERIEHKYQEGSLSTKTVFVRVCWGKLRSEKFSRRNSHIIYFPFYSCHVSFRTLRFSMLMIRIRVLVASMSLFVQIYKNFLIQAFLKPQNHKKTVVQATMHIIC